MRRCGRLRPHKFLLYWILTSATIGSSIMARYNFGPSSHRMPLVFGMEAPGVPLKPGGSYNEPGSVPNDVVQCWIDHLKTNGISRTLCLLNSSELACYADPGYKALCEASGIKPALVDAFAPGAKDGVLQALTEAYAAEENIAVHCSGGEGRTGLVLAACLVEKCGLSAEEAEREIMETAGAEGVVRKVVAAKVTKFLTNGTLA